MQRKLGVMISSCGATLQELESVTMKYREVADPAESDVVHDGPAGLLTAAVSTNPKQTRSVARLKEDIRVNWRKIRWDVERYSLSEYREKLQAHPDAISIVLSTFLWCVLYLSPILRTKQTLGPRPTASRPTGKSIPGRCRSYRTKHYSQTNFCYS